MSLSVSSRWRASVDLPAPEGDDNTSTKPRREISEDLDVLLAELSLNVLYLLAKLINGGLHIKTDMGKLLAGGF